MPFVLVALSHDLKVTKNAIESACKEAWTSMNGIYEVSGLKNSDVGGAACRVTRGSGALISFVYLDRGRQFDEHLYNTLTEKIGRIIDTYFFVETIATEAGMWFADPEWSAKECTSPHRYENIRIESDL